MMASSVPSEAPTDAVVWVNLKGFPWWPCKVVEVEPGEISFISFGDNFNYDRDEFNSKNVRSCDCAELADMLAEGRWSLRKKKKTLGTYQTALHEAEKHIQNFDPTFSFSSLESPAKKVLESPAKKVLMSKLPDNSLSTPGDSASQEESCTVTEVSVDHQKSAADVDQIPSAGEKSLKKKRKRSVSHRNGAGIGKKARLSSCEGDEATATTDVETPKKMDSEANEDHRAGLPVGGETNQEDTVAGNGMETTNPTNSVPGSLSPTSPALPTTPPAHSSSYMYLSLLSDSSHSDLELDSDSDSDLPRIDLSCKDTVEIHELEPKDVIWVKHKADPHWPALISSVHVRKKRKHDAFARLYFFGEEEYSDSLKPIKINKSKKIAPFTANKIEEFTEIGLKSEQKREFERALSEAQQFLTESAEGKYTSRDVKSILQEIVKERLPNPTPILRDWSSDRSEDQEEAVSSHSEDPGPMLQLAPSCSSSEGEDDRPESNAEEDDSSPYTYERVVSEVMCLEPLLLAIMKGEIESSHHRVFTGGSRKERERLKVGNKYGPIKTWPPTRTNKLLTEVLCNIAKKHEEERFGLTYALDVMLPEAMVRIKSKIENISLEQAIKEF